jgi:hypothetical protein
MFASRLPARNACSIVQATSSDLGLATQCQSSFCQTRHDALLRKSWQIQSRHWKNWKVCATVERAVAPQEYAVRVITDADCTFSDVVGDHKLTGACINIDAGHADATMSSVNVPAWLIDHAQNVFWLFKCFHHPAQHNTTQPITLADATSEIAAASYSLV